MAKELFVQVPAVRGYAQNFQEINQVLTEVGKVMQAVSEMLKASAFIGNVGGAAMAFYLDMVRPIVENMAKESQTMSEDLNKSMDAFERGDEQGATRFY